MNITHHVGITFLSTFLTFCAYSMTSDSVPSAREGISIVTFVTTKRGHKDFEKRLDNQILLTLKNENQLFISTAMIRLTWSLNFMNALPLERVALLVNKQADSDKDVNSGEYFDVTSLMFRRTVSWQDDLCVFQFYIEGNVQDDFLPKGKVENTKIYLVVNFKNAPTFSSEVSLLWSNQAPNDFWEEKIPKKRPRIEKFLLCVSPQALIAKNLKIHEDEQGYLWGVITISEIEKLLKGGVSNFGIYEKIDATNPLTKNLLSITNEHIDEMNLGQTLFKKSKFSVSFSVEKSIGKAVPTEMKEDGKGYFWGWLEIPQIIQLISNDLDFFWVHPLY